MIRTRVFVTTLLAASIAGCNSSSESPSPSPDAKLVNIQISEPSLDVFHKSNSTLDLTVTGLYSDDTTKDITESTTWTSNDPATLTINSGVFETHDLGSATITPSVDGFDASAHSVSVDVISEIVGWDHTDTQFVEFEVATDIKQILPNNSSMAVVLQDGTVLTSGYPSFGGDSSAVKSELVDVNYLVTDEQSFAALKNDGTVVFWGEEGDITFASVKSNLVGITSISAAPWGGYAAIKSDGTIVTWGDSGTGGDHSGVAHLLAGVVNVVGSGDGFAALMSDGTVVSWGGADMANYTAVSADLVNVVDIKGNILGGFVARTSDGTAVAWGGSNFPTEYTRLKSDLVDVIDIAIHEGDFAALKSDGTVIGSGVQFGTIQADLTDIVSIASSYQHFFATKSDGTVIPWGDKLDISSLRPELYDIKKIVSSQRGLGAALRNDGTLIRWGSSDSGTLLTGIKDAGISLGMDGLALKDNGELVSWGDRADDLTQWQHLLKDVQSISVGADAGFVVSHKKEEPITE